MFTELQNEIINAILEILTDETGMLTNEELAKNAKEREACLEHDICYVYGGHIYSQKAESKELYCIFPKVIDGKIFIGVDEPMYRNNDDDEPEVFYRRVIGYIPLSDNCFVSAKISNCIRRIGLLIDQR